MDENTSASEKLDEKIFKEMFLGEELNYLDGINKDPIEPNECLRDYFERRYLGIRIMLCTSFWYIPHDGYFGAVRTLTENNGTFSQVLEEMPKLIQSHQGHTQSCFLCRDFTKAYEKYLKKQNPKPGLWQRIRSFWRS